MPLLSALGLGLMLLKELREVLEGDGGPGHEKGLHDLAIFDIAWPVFCPGLALYAGRRSGDVDRRWRAAH